jgi:hypothetical protein
VRRTELLGDAQTADDGDYEYWLVREGEHTGKYAFKQALKPNVFYCDTQDEARADADRLKTFRL